MKRPALALFASTLLCSAVHAAGSDGAALTFDCANLRLPRMVDVGAVTGIDNVGAAYAEREKLLHQAARLCKNPAIAVVRFVPDATVAVQPLDEVAAR